MQFRAEGFNILNSTILAAPVAESSAFANFNTPAQFGLSPGTPDTTHGAPVFSTGGPRKIWLGLKSNF